MLVHDKTPRALYVIIVPTFIRPYYLQTLVCFPCFEEVEIILILFNEMTCNCATAIEGSVQVICNFKPGMLIKGRASCHAGVFGIGLFFNSVSVKLCFCAME